MYAAAGGASIANRRKQKRLQLSKQTPVHVVPPRLKGVPPGSRHHQQHYQHHQHQHQHQHHHQYQYHHHHHHHHHPTKLVTNRSHQVAPTSQVPRAHQQQQAPTSTSSSSAAFHPSIDDRHRHADHHKSQQVAPVSPIQFPISPPPLSLESSASATCPANKSSKFPFPPPSILDLRASPPTSELQCGGQGPGKAAWQGCNRPSPLPLSPTSPGYNREGYRTKQCEAHRRWMKRNRIRDASYCYGSSGEDDEEDDSSNAIRQRGEVSAAVNTVLYVGLGTTALGLIISFVGIGEKGFLSPQLRLVGPSLLCAGLLCCLFRVLLCLCLCRCGPCHWRFCHVASHKKEKARKADARSMGTLPTASLLPPTQRQQQQERPIAPTSRSVSPATKGHELLLSPAQLPE
ncbi:hypothetical protein DMN91_000152 [Ooceraea biroi]|uniref:Uncharacterized protein n=1 Tax=Ooceraea biroi TaxID=2015173 RepID=A0A026VZS5_OOCBI|nr:uncharacterized protein LOC105284748 [Ooceraea biroi]XP_026826832.1 uncharacterized protein LOC105284748 [Ooceraea biroi]XP_026826861.1 uncharacterized protein LOC105284748 [Ooceraea biroi]EZA49308.1 hypothetical protein X777_12338 [Ooceraea biroi]RLU26358.1 hypothetical protein DMN91_000152 [Ooceraea biroi]